MIEDGIQHTLTFDYGAARETLRQDAKQTQAAKTMREHADDWLRVKEYEDRVSWDTLRHYTTSLERLEAANWDTVSIRDNMERDGNAAWTIKNSLNRIKGFAKWLQAKRDIKLEAVKSKTAPHQLFTRDIFTPEEVQKIPASDQLEELRKLRY